MKSLPDLAREILSVPEEEFRSRAFKWYYGSILSPKAELPDQRHVAAFAQAVVRTHEHNRQTGITLERLAA